MRRRVVAIAVSLAAIASIVLAGSNGLPSLSMAVSQPSESAERPSLSSSAKRDYVDMKSDEGWQMEHNGRKIMVVVGNFAAHHNGTVITADSAVRYSERHIECFGNVLINKGTTYIYGDRAEYNGNTNEARVFSQIIKVVDGDATLYTYNFKFNTKTNIGSFSGGGVMISGENMLESERGYVYTDDHNVICVDRVQMRNETYEMTADSVVYNSNTEYAQFFTNTNIWDVKEGDYLYADRGAFDKAKSLYILTRNGYILTKEQELMCDTLNYYRDRGYVHLKSNIQVDDIKQKMLMFGDWGEYWRESGNLFVTREPSAISYDLSQGDSLYMRSDSMFLNTRYPIREKIEKARTDSIEMVKKRHADSLAKIEAAKPKSPEKSASVAEGKGLQGKRGKSARNQQREQKAHKEQQIAPQAQPQPAPMAESAKSEVVTAAVEEKPTATNESSEVVANQPATPTTTPTPTTTTTPTEVKSEVVATTTAPEVKSVNTAEQEKSDSLQAKASQTAKAVKEALRAKREAEVAEKRAQQQQAKETAKKRADSVRTAERKVADSIRTAERKIVDSIRAVKRAVADSLQAIVDEQKRQAYIKVTEARLAELERQHHILDSLQREKDLADSLALVKADSIANAKDSTKVATPKPTAPTVPTTPVVTAPKSESVVGADSVKLDSLKRDSLQVDSLKRDTIVMWSDTMTIKEQKSLYKQRYAELKARIAKIKADTLNAKLDRIGEARQAKRTAIYKRWERQDSIFAAREQARADKRLVRRLARRERRGIYIDIVDSAIIRQADSILIFDVNWQDSISRHKLDSLIEILFPRPIPSPTEVMKSDSMNLDSMYREVLAYSRVKIYRSDFQSVCDSLTTTSVDSVINLHKLPILWNGSNQITSEVMHLHTKNSQLVRANFEGKPITASQLDTAHYNQVTGKEMVSHFRDNQIYRNDVTGNVQTIYYMQEDNSPEITLMAYIEAGDMTSYIENQEVVGITYRGSPTYTFYPMDKIPETQPTRLEGFKWEESRRPTKDSVFTRTIRPSMREERRSLPRPLFPIHALLQQRKDDYMRRQEWRERTDTLSVETIEWLESIKTE